MPELADNNVYLKVGGVAVTAFFREVSLDFKNSGVDTTAGAGVAHTMRAPGLNDTSITMMLAYDTDNVQSFVQKIAPGQVLEIEYGPEGATSGRPRHVQNFLITSNAHTVSVDKSAVSFSIAGEGAEAPTINMNAGAVYP